MTPVLSRSADGWLAGWLHPAAGGTGILIVPGGGQTRVGPHRLFVRLAEHLSQRGYPVLRLDKAGIGDSDGSARDFEANHADLTAACSAFREAAPGVQRIVALGHCDGATAATLSADLFAALILLNPWVVDANDYALPAAAARAHYLRRLSQPESWKRLFSGNLDIAGALKSILVSEDKAADGDADTLAGRVNAALSNFQRLKAIILSDRDRTADIFRARAPASLPVTRLSADHAFSRQAEYGALLDNVDAALTEL